MKQEIPLFPNVIAEELISIAQAGKHIPGRGVSRSVIERWIRKGVKGRILETVKIGKARYTSREAIMRFIDGINRDETNDNSRQPATTVKRYTNKELERKNKEWGLM